MHERFVKALTRSFTVGSRKIMVGFGHMVTMSSINNFECVRGTHYEYSGREKNVSHEIINNH